jgi:hypothetical protein
MDFINKDLETTIKNDNYEKLHVILKTYKITSEIMKKILILTALTNSKKCLEYLIINYKYSDEDLEKTIEKAKLFSNISIINIINIHKTKRIINNINKK